MIIEDYVSFEVAKLLKEKGFDKDIDSRFSPHFSYNSDGCFSGPSWDTKYSAPTLQMVMKWLREVHNTDICVCRELDEYGDCFDGYISVVYSNKVYRVTIRDVEKDLSFEEAAEAAIKYCLTNLI